MGGRREFICFRKRATATMLSIDHPKQKPEAWENIMEKYLELADELPYVTAILKLIQLEIIVPFFSLSHQILSGFDSNPMVEIFLYLQSVFEWI
jgi:hypothetical protein